MSAPQLFQLAPTGSFTEAQRRELNAIFLRQSQAVTTILFGLSIEQRPDAGIPNRIWISTNEPPIPGTKALYLDTGLLWVQIL